MKKWPHPYFLWFVVLGGCVWLLLCAYRLYLLDGFSHRVQYTLLSGLPLVVIGGYLLFAIYAAQKKQRPEQDALPYDHKTEEGIWPPPPATTTYNEVTNTKD